MRGTIVRTALLAFVVALLPASVAEARTVIHPDSDTRSVPEGEAASFLSTAEDYWGRMLPGRQPPCSVALRFMSDSEWSALAAEHRFSPDASAAADTWGCRIWLRRTWWNSYPPSPHTTQALCTTVVHEYGHNIGLGHTPNYPVMENAAPAEECRIAAGEEGVVLTPNPHLPKTQRLYRRGAKLVERHTKLRGGSHTQRRKVARRIWRVRSRIREVEGTLPARPRFRNGWPPKAS